MAFWMSLTLILHISSSVATTARYSLQPLALLVLAPTAVRSVSSRDPWWTPLAPSKGCTDECNRHGACKSGVCFCFGGWTGETCGVRECTPTCVHGVCHDGACACASGWAGKACSDPWCPAACSGHGACVNGTCTCADGWGGNDCSRTADPPTLACPKDCSSRGDCYLGRCHCRPPFGGVDCSQLLLHSPPSSPSPPPSLLKRLLGRRAAADDDGNSTVALLSGPCAAAFGEMHGHTHGGTTFGHDNPCGPNGRCERGATRCTCLSGWQGALCDEPACPHACSGRDEA